jgi:hypothetical protein
MPAVLVSALILPPVAVHIRTGCTADSKPARVMAPIIPGRHLDSPVGHPDVIPMSDLVFRLPEAQDPGWAPAPDHDMLVAGCAERQSRSW